MKKLVKQTKSSVKKPVLKKSKKEDFPRYYNHEGKSKRIPKIVLGMHIDIIKMYFMIPVSLRKNFKQVIIKSTDVLTFGPMNGKQFKALINSNSGEMRDYYKTKIFGAFKTEGFAVKVARFMNASPVFEGNILQNNKITFTEEVQ